MLLRVLELPAGVGVWGADHGLFACQPTNVRNAPARPSPALSACGAEGRTSMRSTSDSGIVLRSNWPLDEYDAESPALRPFISTSVVPRGNPRIWTVVEFAFPPPTMPVPSPITISPLLLTETSDRYDSTCAILHEPNQSIGHWINMTLNPRLCVRLSAPVSFLAVIHASGRSLSLRFRHLRCRFQVQSRYRHCC